MFMWSKSVKEAMIYEENFKNSLQMIFEGERYPMSYPKSYGISSSPEKHVPKRIDGIPSIDKSISNQQARQCSTSKYLLNDDDFDDRMSNLSEIFEPNDQQKFIKVYNMQGHYSAS